MAWITVYKNGGEDLLSSAMASATQSLYKAGSSPFILSHLISFIEIKSNG
jgi:hypothetical protein